MTSSLAPTPSSQHVFQHEQPNSQYTVNDPNGLQHVKNAVVDAAQKLNNVTSEFSSPDDLAPKNFHDDVEVKGVAEDAVASPASPEISAPVNGVDRAQEAPVDEDEGDDAMAIDAPTPENAPLSPAPSNEQDAPEGSTALAATTTAAATATRAPAASPNGDAHSSVAPISTVTPAKEPASPPATPAERSLPTSDVMDEDAKPVEGSGAAAVPQPSSQDDAATATVSDPAAASQQSTIAMDTDPSSQSDIAAASAAQSVDARESALAPVAEPTPANPNGEVVSAPALSPAPAPVDNPSSSTSALSNGIVAKGEPKQESDAMIDRADERPAKRARTDDIASPVASIHDAAIPELPRDHTTFSAAQYKFAQSTLRSLRKPKDAFYFNQPVDIVALNIPHYPNIVAKPMDFSTIEKKLAVSNPTKPEPNAPHGRYLSAQAWIEDLKLVFDNCFAFNGPDHIVSLAAKRLQAQLERLLKNLPIAGPPTRLFKSPPPERLPLSTSNSAPTASTSKLPPANVASKKPARRSSTTLPTIRRSDSATAPDFVNARPKREIHPPPPKDLDYGPTPAPPLKRPSGGPPVTKRSKKKDDGTADQLRFCVKIVNDLYKKQYADFAQFFYDPVDEKAVPNYYKVIKSPMDMSTLKRNLDQKKYPDALSFYDDFQLMINNSVKFNPVGTLVYIAGQDLARVFNEKWRMLPPLHSPQPSDDEYEDGGPGGGTIQALEAELAGIRDKIDALKNKETAAKKVKQHEASARAAIRNEQAELERLERQQGRSSSSAPGASSSRGGGGGAARSGKKSGTKKNGPGKKAGGAGSGSRKLEADTALTFEEKKELSETIQTLESPALDEVIAIIHEGMPDLGDNSEEIEIEIDSLPPTVLRQLWNAVIAPKRPAPAPAIATSSNKPFKSGKNQAGTGGIKRKSMDEEVEAEKMRQLEARISMFDTPTAGGVNGSGDAQRSGSMSTIHNGAANAVGGGDADSTHSSDSEESDSDSSDSD